MPHRFILYDALESLEAGNVMFVVDPACSFLQRLEGVPEVHVICEMLIENGWVYPIDDSEKRFAITPRGREVLQRGREQYQQFSWFKKVFGRALLLRW